MAHIIADRVQETTTTTGTGAITLAGAVANYKTFASRMTSPSDTCWYAIVDSTNNAWEVGLGTYSAANTLTRTTVIRSSNSDTVVTLASGTKNVFMTLAADKTPIFDPNGGISMPKVTAASMPTPAADTLTFFAKKLAGRMIPKWVPPSGVDNPVQPAIFGNRIVTFAPNTGTTGTGQGMGPVWTSNGTVTHPTPATTAPAISNQMKRTRYANVVTTTNQQLGPRFNAASEQQFWRGNASGLGGFFFQTRFIVELYPASTVRIFAGLTSTNTGSVAISDTVLANTCGLWHDTTDASSVFNFVTKDATTANKQTITLSNNIAAGNSYDFYMYAKPNDTVIYYRLDDIVNNVTYEGSDSGSTLPVSTAFMQPQVQMSNGTANITVTTTAIGVAGIYVESDR